jgi:hopanoid biosynthesis associated protein HpnK
VRRLIVNADDFGFTRDVNEGIARAFEHGILRSATLMANGGAFDHAVATAQALPGLDVGAHLTLVGGPSVADPRRRLPASLAGMLLAYPSGWSRAAIEEECCAQLEKIENAGIPISHVDAHKHTHLFPPVLEALVRAAKRYGVVWVRRPFDIPLTAAAARSPWRRRLTSRLLAGLGSHFDRRMRAAGLRSTDAFAGFQMTGLYQADQLAALMRALPPGLTELMCHPGLCGEQLLAARTRLKRSREAELAALTSDLVKRTVEETGVEITSFRALCGVPAPVR